MDVLESLVEGRFRNTLVVKFKEGTKKRCCGLPVDYLLLVQHEDMCHIHENIGIGYIAVRVHGREKLGHLSGSLSGKASSPHHIFWRHVPNLV